MSIRVAIRLFVFLSCWFCTLQEILELLTSQTSIPDDVLATVNLTERELELLPEINWGNFSPESLDLFKRGTVSGIPAGVNCQTIDWCDSITCTEVCKRGTVQLEPWLQSAIKSQVALSRQLPLCYAQWLGSHNSGITLSDGYGNRDRYYTKLLKLTRWDQAYVFETHNQWFSLTDQLNMGVRVLELDVHWVKGALRIAHCGGLTNAVLDYIASLVNLVSKLIGRPIRWDVETIGCYPSASSIEAKDQRPLLEAMEEISDWLKKEENSNEFLMILLDDQHDLAFWGLLPLLKKQLVRFMPLDWVFTPSDTHLITNGTLPSADYLLSHNKRVMFVSQEYFRDPIMRSFVFYTEDGWLCAWNEPHMDALDLGQCTLPNHDYTERVPTMSGFISRLQTCEIRYGPLSCALKFKDTEQVLDDELLTKVFGCGYSFPSPDRVTPERVKSMIWSWTSEAQWSSQNNKETVISSEDGHWRLKDPHLIKALPIACVNMNSTLHYEWALHSPPPPHVDGETPCHEGFLPAIPRHGKENSNLQKAMKQRGINEARIIGAEHYLSTT